MKIISWNVNGLRAVYKKGFLVWLRKTQADIVCLQEIKAQPEQLPSCLIHPEDYHFCFNSAVKKGYSGVAVYTKEKPLEVKTKLGIKRFDQEGRLLKIKFPSFILFNLYLPHGGRKKENLNYKLKTYDRFLKSLEKIRKRKILLIGDFNIAHQEIDLARPKGNKNNIMFTLEERKQIDKLISLGFTDIFRKFYKKGGHYTWWSYHHNARKRNLGWRIDYTFSSKSLTPSVKDAFILSRVKGSDHCPIGVAMSNQ